MNKTIRTATEKATGRKYIVQQLEFPKGGEGLVHVWGECIWVKGTNSKHEGSKTFKRSEVEIAEVEKTKSLLGELFQQALKVLRSQGADVYVARG